MPKERLEENATLPKRWRYRHGAYFYRVPPGLEPYWDYRQEFRLGATLEESIKNFSERLKSDQIKTLLNNKNLLDQSDICRESLILPTKPGVYFLFREKEIVYIGRSDNIIYRISQHVKESRIRFDRIAWILCCGAEQVLTEQLYIMKFTPVHNIQHTSKDINSMGRIEPNGKE